MSFGFGLGSGLRALTAARLGMQTAGNNISNANTVGYSRQRVELSAALPYSIAGGHQIGNGVDVARIGRLFDDGLERRMQMQLSLLGAAELDHSRLGEVESILGEPDGGLSDGIAGLFGAIGQLQTDPADRALRGGVVQAADGLSQGFRLAMQRFGDLASSSFEEVRGLVRTVNQHSQTIAELNSQISSAEANGRPANDLRDARAQHVREIGKLIDVRPIERPSGSLDLLVGGNLMVAGDRATALGVGKTADGKTRVTVGSSIADATLREGRIAALLRAEQTGVPAISDRIDRLARNLILEMNRMHSTGMPRSGPFESLTSHYGAVDGDGDGRKGDEFLSQSGFPFDVQSGELAISVTDKATGQMQRTRLAIDPTTTSLNDVAAALDGIEHLNASVDPSGRLRIAADPGYGFDFSPRVDPNPDDLGSFGGMFPSIGSSRSEPFDLSGQTFPMSLQITTGAAGTTTTDTITLDAGDFADLGAVTAEELAAAINADFNGNGTAAAVGGRLVLQGAQGGSTAELSVANVGTGTALAALGLPTVTAQGRDNAIEVAMEGTYQGDANERFTFVPTGDGTIGQADALQIAVYDSAGRFVTNLDVGSGYEPGEPIELGNGLSVSFGPGEVSGTAGHVFAADALADADTSDLLVALGMNTFFTGSGAADIAVSQQLRDNPDHFSAGIGLAAGDAGNLARMQGLRERNLGDLETNTIEDFYADLVGDIGFESSAAASTLNSQKQLMSQLEAERESVSGVNIDEEMVDMLKFQQSYEAAARFLQVAQEMTDTLINLGR
ncbi:MAG: Flagellar hook-associated protein 1 [Planctomycetota bacterium]